jgi:hypothetical protein
MELIGPGFDAERLVVATVSLDSETTRVYRDGKAEGFPPRDIARIREQQRALLSRLASEDGVAGVTFSSAIPGFAGGSRIEIEDTRGDRHARSFDVSTLDVDPNLFDMYRVELIAGRGFTTGDLGGGAAVIVNQTFAEQLQRTAASSTSRDPRQELGRRFRYTDDPARAQTWYEIVGIVRDFPSFPPAVSADPEAVVYHPAGLGEVRPFVLSMRFQAQVPPSFSERFRAIAADVNPSMQVLRAVRLSDFYDQQRSVWRYLAGGAAAITTSILLLSAAGIYALLSFIVAQRTREIGIRTALGAQPRSILWGIFARVARQFTIGGILGSAIAAAALAAAGLDFSRALPLLGVVAMLMLLVGILAAIGPARRGLTIHVTEALRADM